MKTNKEKFGARLKEIRRKKRMSQVTLSEVLNKSNGVISNYETGYTFPTVETLILIANTFDVSIDYLLGRDVE